MNRFEPLQRFEFMNSLKFSKGTCVKHERGRDRPSTRHVLSEFGLNLRDSPRGHFTCKLCENNNNFIMFMRELKQINRKNAIVCIAETHLYSYNVIRFSSNPK